MISLNFRDIKIQFIIVRMGAITCCQNQVYRLSQFREYCQHVSAPEYKGKLAAIQNQEFHSSPQLVTLNRQYKEGDWKKGGQQTGKGVIFAPQQFYYEGQIVKGVAKGQGRIIWPNKFSYKGSIEDNKASGYGQFSFGSKNISLKGNWIRGFPKLNEKMVLHKQGKQGSITFVEPFNLKTEEQFFKETLHVKVEFGNGLVYQGEVKQKNNLYKIEGRGRMNYPDDSYYQGQFIEGKMDGHGKYYWGTTGNWFQGEYKSNFREGKGTYYYSHSEYQTGEWKGGVLLKGQPQGHHQQKAASQHPAIPTV